MTCCELTLRLVELLSQLQMQNITTKCSNILHYNNSNNNYTLTTAKHFNKSHCGQTDRQADIVTCRAAIKAKNAKYDYRMI